MIGYTKDYTVGVWCGFGTNGSEKYLNRTTKNIPINIMKMILNKIANGYQKYSAPKGLSYLSVEIIDGKIYEYNEFSKHIYSDYFFNGYQPIKKNENDLEEF